MKFDNSGEPSKIENPAIKTYPARIVGIYDIGKQPGYEQGDDPKNQMIFLYELKGKERKEDGKPFVQPEFMTVSLHVKATLPKRLKALGAPIEFQNDDWYKLPANYAISDLLGEPCMVEIVAGKGEGKVKVGSVMAPVEGLNIPEAETEFGFLDLDADDYLDQMMTVPKWIVKKVEQSEGYFSNDNQK